MRAIVAAPVALHDLAVADGRITGYAAPAGGSLPCALLVEADDEIVAIACATSFSTDAAARGVRHGWCGVTLGGLDIAAALADRVVVRCAASKVILLEVEAPAPPPPSPDRLSPEGLLAAMRQVGCGDDPATLLPFAEATLRRHGTAAMLDAAYLTLLSRAADAAVAAAWATAPPPDPAQAVLAMIARAPEFLKRSGRIVPGPFHPAFAFDRDLIDG